MFSNTEHKHPRLVAIMYRLRMLRKNRQMKRKTANKTRNHNRRNK